MQTTAYSNYIRVAPRKMKLLADSVRDLTPERAEMVLKYMNHSAALPLGKVIHSAISNAVQKGLNKDALRFTTLEVLPGSAMKRFRAVSRGMAHTYKKRMSHLKVVLSDESTLPSSQILTAKIPTSRVNRKVQSGNANVQNNLK